MTMTPITNQKMTLNKSCSNCGESKPLSDYYNYKNCKDGKSGQCKKCVSKKQHNNYLNKKEAHLEAGRIYRIKNKEKLNAKTRELNAKLKETVFSGYCNGTPKCSCCGESHIEFLSIDHVNNDGYEKRKNGESRGLDLYRKLIKLGFPVGYDVLCMNCNFAKGHGKKICPHKLEAKV